MLPSTSATESLRTPEKGLSGKATAAQNRPEIADQPERYGLDAKFDDPYTRDDGFTARSAGIGNLVLRLGTSNSMNIVVPEADWSLPIAPASLSIGIRQLQWTYVTLFCLSMYGFSIPMVVRYNAPSKWFAGGCGI